MARAIILMLDSLGIGAAPDAARFTGRTRDGRAFDDTGSDTLGHIAAACARGEADRAGVRSGSLVAPNLARVGLGAAAALATGRVPHGLDHPAPEGLFAAAAERSKGKDTPSGHWEMAGVPVAFDWGLFPDTEPCFPAELTEALIRRGNLPGVLGNKHASGTEIITELGLDHMRTGRPIVYTSADSVFQIAAHEETFGLQRLMDLCHLARDLVDAYNIGRVIARPFVGDGPQTFRRTGNRRDLAVPPPAPTLLQVAEAAGREVIAIGKIADIYAHLGPTRKVKAEGNAALFDATLQAMDEAPDGSVVFTNFVDFDMLYGHRRDVPGYAAAIEAFDRRLPDLEAKLRPGDLVLITADHGCDPTWPGTDHTREYVPMVLFGPAVGARGPAGRRDTFADMGQTLAAHLGLPPLAAGEAVSVAAPA